MYAGQVCLLMMVVALVVMDVTANAAKAKALFNEPAKVDGQQFASLSGWTSQCVNGYTLTLTACQKPEGDDQDDNVEDGELFSEEMINYWNMEQDKNIKHKKVPSINGGHL